MFLSFYHKSRVCQRDGQTDRQTDRQTVFSWLDRVACNGCIMQRRNKTKTTANARRGVPYGRT